MNKCMCAGSPSMDELVKNSQIYINTRQPTHKRAVCLSVCRRSVGVVVRVSRLHQRLWASLTLKQHTHVRRANFPTQVPRLVRGGGWLGHVVGGIRGANRIDGTHVPGDPPGSGRHVLKANAKSSSVLASERRFCLIVVVSLCPSHLVPSLDSTAHSGGKCATAQIVGLCAYAYFVLLSRHSVEMALVVRLAKSAPGSSRFVLHSACRFMHANRQKSFAYV